MNKEPTFYRDPVPRPAIGYLPSFARGGIAEAIEQIESYINTYEVLQDTPLARGNTARKGALW